jgi:hypothetical protein
MSNAEQDFWARMGVYFPNGDMGMVTNGGDAAAERKRQVDALIGTKDELKLATHYITETGDCSWDFAKAFARQRAAGGLDAKTWHQKTRGGRREN